MKLFKVINPPTNKEMLYAAENKQHAYEVAQNVLTEFWITNKGICEKRLPMDKAMAYIEEIPGYSIEGKPGLVYSDFNPIKVGE